MKFSNFAITKTKGCGIDKTFFGKLDVTTGALFWKKTTTRTVARQLGGNWFFADTGKWCPCLEVKALERAFRANNDLT